VIENALFPRWFLNSMIASLTVVAGNLIFGVLAGYAFARMRFRGSRLLLAVMLGTLIIPFQITMIPTFLIMKKLGLIDTLGAVIVPSLVTPFAVFLFRQFFLSLPREIEEAAWIDGCSRLRTLWSVVVPMARPALSTVAVLTFLTTWNEFFWPILALSSQNPTIQVAFQSLATGFAPQQSIIMAGTLYGTIPVLIAFAILGKHIVGGIMQGAVKG
jgi:multiple sugar transport system permease protein